MSKRMLVTNCEVPLNEAIVRHYLGRGLQVVAQTEEADVTERLRVMAQESGWADRLAVLTLPVGSHLVEATLALFDRLDVCVVGIPSVDEAGLWSEDPLRLKSEVEERLHQMYSLCRAVCGQMLLFKQGSLIFPLVYEPLDYEGVTTSPILDHAKIVFAKSLAKEMAAFKVGVNLITFGGMADGLSKPERKQRLERMEFFNLKPRLRSLEEAVPAMDMLVFPPVDFLSGQNIILEAGMQIDI